MTTNQSKNADNKEMPTDNDSWFEKIEKFINKYLIIHPKEDK